MPNPGTRHAVDDRIVEDFDDDLVVGPDQLECGIDRTYLFGARRARREQQQRRAADAAERGRLLDQLTLTELTFAINRR